MRIMLQESFQKSILKLNMKKIIVISILLTLLELVSTNEFKKSIRNDQTSINLAIVACNDRVPDALTSLKSALMFTNTYLNFYIITESHLKHLFIEQVIIRLL